MNTASTVSARVRSPTASPSQISSSKREIRQPRAASCRIASNSARRDHIANSLLRENLSQADIFWWSRSGSNRLPLECHYSLRPLRYRRPLPFRDSTVQQLISFDGDLTSNVWAERRPRYNLLQLISKLTFLITKVRSFCV